MSFRYSIKIAGQSGQGIDSLGKILSNTLLSHGYFVVGYREYPSLIKGGKSSFQIDISDVEIYAVNRKVDILVVLNEQLTSWYVSDLKQNSIIFHNIQKPRFCENDINILNKFDLNWLFLDSKSEIKKILSSPRMEYILIISKLCNILGLNFDLFSNAIKKEFSNKSKTIIDKNIEVAKYGYEIELKDWKSYGYEFHKLSHSLDIDKFKFIPENLYEFPHVTASNLSKNIDLISGNEAIALSTLDAGLKTYFGYPMTPSSGILTHLSDICQNNNNVIVKQVEDEISAIAMSIGSNIVGEKSMTATSGGGFDLMSEHISYAMLARIPQVIVLAQRPGPATGLPTWTAQGDLLTSIFGGHGEGNKVVISYADIIDCRYNLANIFELAYKFKIPVIILTDKYIGETYFTIDIDKVEIFKEIYERIDNNIFKSKFIIQNYSVNSDEHDIYGDSIEDSSTVILNANHRLELQKEILENLPKPRIYSVNNIGAIYNLKIISWGSTKNTILDTFDGIKNINIDYLHYDFLWPFDSNSLINFISSDLNNTIIIEGNSTSQLAKLIKMETGMSIPNSILKYDGRPFFVDELYASIQKVVYDIQNNNFRIENN